MLPNSDQAWRGNITLDNTVPIQIPNSGRLTVYGTIDDAPNTAVEGSGITLTGVGGVGGALNLAGINSFRGTMNVSQGVLTVQNGQALGGTGVADVQMISLVGATPNLTTFTLAFNNGTSTSTTGPITYTGTAADTAAIAGALNSLPSVVAAGGVVTVTRNNATTFSISLGGNLLGFDQQPLVATVTSADSATVTATVTTTVHGAGGTIVANGAALRVQGNISVSGEPLMVEGQGASTPPSMPVTWFNIGPAPELNGQVAGSGNVAGRTTGVAVDPSDPNVIYIATAGGGAWKTINGGQTWLPIFDASYGLHGGAIAVAPSDPRRHLLRHWRGRRLARLVCRHRGLQVDRLRKDLDSADDPGHHPQPDERTGGFPDRRRSR